MSWHMLPMQPVHIHTSYDCMMTCRLMCESMICYCTIQCHSFVQVVMISDSEREGPELARLKAQALLFKLPLCTLLGC